MRSTTTNQSAAEAERLSTEAGRINDWMIDDRLIWSQLANAQAQLALAEEQRTANLLALAADEAMPRPVANAAATEAARRLNLIDKEKPNA